MHKGESQLQFVVQHSYLKYTNTVAVSTAGYWGEDILVVTVQMIFFF